MTETIRTAMLALSIATFLAILIFSSFGCASFEQPYSHDDRACFREAVELCGTINRCSHERHRECMGRAGWDRVFGQGWVRRQIDADLLREIGGAR